MSTHVLNLELQLMLCPVLCALATQVSQSMAAATGRSMPSCRDANLERQVLEEMSGAIGLVRLCARAGVNPHADRGRLSPW